MSLKIRKIPTKKHNIPLRKNMKNGTIPPYPCSIILSGRSGSGKTNLLMNLLDPASNELYGNYYHYIFYRMINIQSTIYYSLTVSFIIIITTLITTLVLFN